MSDFDEVVRLLEGLSTEMQNGFAEVRAEMRAGFAELRAGLDRQQVRVERHGALLQTGSRWVNHMNQWAEKVDRLLAERDAQIHQLEERVQHLERNGHRKQE